MDIIAEPTNDFQDWELLQPTSDSDSAVSLHDHIHSGPLIHLNYFSLDAPAPTEVLDDQKSDNPSWIDPGSEQDNPIRYLHKDDGEFWSDSSSEDLRKSGEFDRNETENEKKEIIFGEVVDKQGEKVEKLGNFYSDSSGIELDSAAKSDDFMKENSDVGVEGNVNLHHGSDILDEGNNENGSGGEVIDDTGNNNSAGGELGKRSLVWWKMPMEFLRYFVFRMSPVWTISVAAAAMGFVILGRRLYTMKKKTKGLQIKVTLDDKKVSQVMSRADRLNEAFSIVKRVPVIRPSLPAFGVTPWPVMSLR